MTDDYISRQAALSTVQNLYDRCDTGSMQDYHDLLMEAFEILPSADAAKVRHGKWETYIISMLDGEGCRCSECRFEGVPYWDYCPNCGARMDGEEK